MSANPSSRWFWNDWDNDRGLQLCSLAAQGLWMRMLSIAARAGGYVRVGDKACSTADIAALIGKQADEVALLIDELAVRGVFSRTRYGTIYSRRMLRDSKRSAINSTNGRRGGNPTLLKQTQKNTSVKPSPSATPSPLSPLVPIPKKDTRKRVASLEGFEIWWQGYPRKVGKADAEKAWPKALALASVEELAAGCISYVADCAMLGMEERFIKHPATWLNGKHWLDEPIKKPNGHAAPNGLMNYDEPWPQRIRSWKRDGVWMFDQWGPRPGEPGCRAPEALL